MNKDDMVSAAYAQGRRDQRKSDEAALKKALEALEQDNPAGRTATIAALRAALAEQEQDKRTTVADLRDAMWLDPECADKGACQSLKFKCPAKPVQEPVAAERDRLLSLAKRRAGQEASAAAHHAGRWHAAQEHHLTRHAAMLDLIDALAEAATENSSEVEPPAEGGTPSWGIDWGRDGDRVCVSITKMLPNGSIEIVDTQYEPPGWRQQKTD